MWCISGWSRWASPGMSAAPAGLSRLKQGWRDGHDQIALEVGYTNRGTVPAAQHLLELLRPPDVGELSPKRFESQGPSVAVAHTSPMASVGVVCTTLPALDGSPNE